MIHDDAVYGEPLVIFKDSEANIEGGSYTEGAIAYATDEHDFGFLDNAAWQWMKQTYLALAGGTLTGNLVIDGGGFVGNESGGNYDFRWESQASAYGLFYDASTGMLGINKQPSTVLDIQCVDANGLKVTGVDSSYPVTSFSSYSSGAAWHGNFFQGRRYRGIQASPAAVANGDVIFYYDMYGADSSSTITRGGQFYCSVNGAVSSGIVPTLWRFNNMDSSGNLNCNLMILANRNVGIATTAPGQIFDVNQGSGNMIADGYDSHSLGEYKTDIQEVGEMLDKLVKAKPKRYKRQVFVSAEELKSFAIKNFGAERWMAEFGGEQDFTGMVVGDDYHSGKMWDMKDKDLQTAIDTHAEGLRKEREIEERWSRDRLGMIADDPDTIENLPEIVARDYESGAPKGISLVDYVAALHAGLIELKEQFDRAQLMARVEK